MRVIEDMERCRKADASFKSSSIRTRSASTMFTHGQQCQDIINTLTLIQPHLFLVAAHALSSIYIESTLTFSSGGDGESYVR